MSLTHAMNVADVLLCTTCPFVHPMQYATYSRDPLVLAAGKRDGSRLQLFHRSVIDTINVQQHGLVQHEAEWEQTDQEGRMALQRWTAQWWLWQWQHWPQERLQRSQ